MNNELDIASLFTATREQPFRMVDAAPSSAARGSAPFAGTARPGEFFLFQIGIVPDQDTGSLAIRFPDLVGDSARISASAQRCLSLGGINTGGIPFLKDISAATGVVQILWCAIDVPHQAAGSYRGKIELFGGTQTLGIVDVTLLVEGEPVDDHGDGTARKLSRLRWLDSTVGSEPTLTAPFTPVQAAGRTVKVQGRELILGENGLPVAVNSYFNASNTKVTDHNRPVLQGPFALTVETEAGVLTWHHRFGQLTCSELAAYWTAESEGEGVRAHVAGQLDYTGSGQLSITLQMHRAMAIKDIRLEIPWLEDAAAYFMGLNHQGGSRPTEPIHWQWDVTKHQDCFWMGDINAGLMLRFKDEKYVKPLVNIYYEFAPLRLPDSWGNAGHGGITIGQAREGVVPVSVYCGPRRLVEGESLTFVIDFYLTPFRPLDTEKQWSVRFDHPQPMRTSGALAATLEDMDPVSGANVLNVHQAHAAAPYINYPYADDSLPELVDVIRRGHAKGVKVSIYYTTREITQNMPELHALHSMNGEIIFPGPGIATRTCINNNGPHPWLAENLGHDFLPAWVDHLGLLNAEWDLSVLTTPDSRWNNFYLEGLRWLCEKMDIDGVYLDDTALDADSLRRARRILDQKPGRLIDFHTWNHFNNLAGFANNLNIYMELLPYLDRLWIGEGFHCDQVSADYWLVEMSGIPFGLMGEMLDHPNPWRGLVFGQVARLSWSGDPQPIWKAWDEYGIQGTTFVPFTDRNNPVKTRRSDVLATVYRKEGLCLIALASWALETVDVALAIDWESLELDRERSILYAPPIAGFQQDALWKPGDLIKVDPGRGWFLVLEEVLHDRKYIDS